MLTRIQATFEKIEGENILLILEDGQKLRVAREDLQPLPEVGTSFTLQIQPSVEAELSEAALARHLLNQLLDDQKAS